jgi:hypothetical protein
MDVKVSLNYVCTLWHPLNYVCTSLSSIELCLYIFDIHWIMFVHLWHPLNSVSTSLLSIELCLYIFGSSNGWQRCTSIIQWMSKCTNIIQWMSKCTNTIQWMSKMYKHNSMDVKVYKENSTADPLSYVCTSLTSIELCLYIFDIHWIMLVHLCHPLNYACTLWHPLSYVCTSL